MAMNFNTSPYYNDFDEEKAFYDILFKPGLAVQARELSQIQSILQNQVSKFGDHVFKNGSVVIPGEVNMDVEVHFAKLTDTYNTVSVKTYLSQFDNLIVTGETSGVTAVVSDTSEGGNVTDTTIPTLYFRILGTGSDGETSRFIPGENIIAYAVDNTVAKNPRISSNLVGDMGVTGLYSAGVSTTYLNDPVNDVMGNAAFVEVRAGIYFLNGRFVHTPQARLFVGPYQNNISTRVGFEVVEEIITSEDDTTLLDPAQGSYNYAAPGADRYKISVNLVQRDYDQTVSTGIFFVELIRIKNGILQSKITKSDYAELEKTLARRTYDESGSYEVTKFTLAGREHLDTGSNFGMFPLDPQDETTIAGKQYGDENKFVIVVSAGKAYVEGYEVESSTPQFIEFNKAREDGQGAENGHVHREDEYPVPTPVGTYVLVDNVANGYFLIGNNSFELIDLVGEYQYDTAYVGTSSTNNLKVGTARVKFISLHSSDYTGNPQYKLGLFDVKMDSGKNFTVDVKGVRRRNFPDLTTLGANIVPSSSQGTKTGSVIVSGTDTITGSGTLFLEEYDVGDVVVISGSVVGEVTSITSQTSMQVDNVNTITASGRPQIFRSIFADKEYQNLFFDTGTQFVRTLKGWDGSGDTELNMDLSVQRMRTQQSDGSGVFQYALPANENFLSDQVISNFMMYEGSLLSSAATLVPLSSGNISFDGSRTTITITGLTPSVTHTLYYGVRLNGGIPSSARTKVLVEDYSQTVLGQKVAAALDVYLAHADVFRIKDIRVSPGTYDTYTESGSISILNNYNFDDGQRPTHYELSKISLKQSVAIPATGALKIIYDYFDSTAGTGSYFSVDSYASIPYEDIPYTISAAGVKYRLSDVIDFRPIISGANNTSTSLPIIGTDFSTSISYYLGRQDKLFLSSVGNFQVITGVPSITPREPVDPKNGMVLATIKVAPYTLSSSDIVVNQRDNRRYTMNDIGAIDRRLVNVEEYIKLSELEKQAANLKITDSNGDESFKNGFLTDPFLGHNVGDITHPDYSVSVDVANKIMRPTHSTVDLSLVEDVDSPAERVWGVSNDGKILFLPPTSEVAIVNNPYASRSIDVNPYTSGGFISNIQLQPESDMWKDTDRQPDLNIVDNNNSESIALLTEQVSNFVGTQWNEWETQWSGVEDTQLSEEIFSDSRGRNFVNVQRVATLRSTRAGERIAARDSRTNSQSYGDRVVGFDYIPFMRARPILVMVDNLKADTKFWPFFDNVDVSEYVRPADRFTVTSPAGMNFNQNSLMDDIIPNVPERMHNGVLEPAFSTGDVIKGPARIDANITAIVGVNTTTIDVTVSSTTSISVGHHVVLYGLANMSNNISYGVSLSSSAIITNPSNTARQLNLRNFVVSAINGSVLSLKEIDGSVIGSFDPYAAGSYSSGSARIARLQASGVVVKEGEVITETGGIPTTRDIFVVNIKNGFGEGDSLLGSVGSPVNAVTLDSVNSGAPAAQLGDLIRTDSVGSGVGTFFLPSNDTLSFRTGERKFKLIDNRSNNELGFDSKGEATYYSTGFNIQKERTVVSSRSVLTEMQTVTESSEVVRVSTIRRLIQPPRIRNRRDPLAQSFTTRAPMMVNSVDLYFEEAGAAPITVEIRATNNGVPGQKIIPGSQVIKQPSEINTSLDSSAATRFTFDNPIYLIEGETYAVVVRCTQEGARCYASELGKTDILSQNVIINNPLTGSLYMSQNTIEWQIYPLMDLKIQLNQYQFAVGSTTIKLKAEPPKPMKLGNDPFEIAVQTAPTRVGVSSDGFEGWPIVRVHAPNHGLSSGQLVTISGVASGVYGSGDGVNGIPHSVLNNIFTIYNPMNDNLDLGGMDKDYFVIKIDPDQIIGNVNNLVHGSYGGAAVHITRQINMDIFKYACNDIIPDGTSVSYNVRARNAARTATSLLPFVANSNFFWPERKLILNAENQAAVDGLDSLEFTAVLTTTNPDLSPYIDLSRTSVFAVSNVVNNGALNPPYVDEFDRRTLFDQDTLVIETGSTVASGQITTNSASTTLQGDGSARFLTEVKVGYDVYRESDNLFLGTVESITNNTTLEFVANAAVTVSSPVDYRITSRRQVLFYNESGKGVISTSIDSADNLLELTSAGNPIYIDGIHVGIDGNYSVLDVEAVVDNEYVGNADEEKVLIKLKTPFPSNVTHAVDGINNQILTSLSQVVTSSTASAVINGAAGSLFTTEVQVGDIVVTEAGLVLGAVLMVDSDVVLTLENLAAYTVVDGVVAIQAPLTTYDISEVYGFADDNAPFGSYNASNYISKELELDLPADSLIVKFDANTPSSTDIDVYYRVGSASESLVDEIWQDAGFVVTSYQPEDTFISHSLKVENIGQFEKVAVKICLKSLKPIAVPKIRNLQIISYS